MKLKFMEQPPLNLNLMTCPHCGEEIRQDASFCRHCGSSDSDGWGEESYDADDDFDYEQFVDDNFGDSKVSTTLPPVWRFVVAVLVIAFVASMLVPLFS